MTISSLELPFTARGVDGLVHVAVYPNDEPASSGSPDWTHGFPICEATVHWEAQGYTALLGWIQLVGMRWPGTSGQREWVIDPLQIYAGLDTPFGFYGISPTLFDAPGRSDKTNPLDWHAESFLCFAPSSPMAREAYPATGFSWGFLIDGGQVAPVKPEALTQSAWTEHLDLLRSSWPGWSFLAVS